MAGDQKISPRIVALQDYWRTNSGLGNADVTLVDPSVRRTPDVYIIGAQKAGTTWLANQLQWHPQCWVPAIKELFYFDQVHIYPRDSWPFERRLHTWKTFRDDPVFQPLVENMKFWCKEYIVAMQSLYLDRDRVVDDFWYAANFAHCGSNQLAFDVSPSYSTLPVAAVAHMRRISPHARIIFILRNPIERAWSHFRMELDALGDYSLESQRRTLEEKANPLFVYSNYAQIYHNYLRCFPRDSILLLDFKRIALEPYAVLKDIFEFLHLDCSIDFFPSLDEKAFEGKSLQGNPEIVAEMTKMIAPVYPACYRAFPDIAPNWAPELRAR